MNETWTTLPYDLFVHLIKIGDIKGKDVMTLYTVFKNYDPQLAENKFRNDLFHKLVVNEKIPLPPLNINNLSIRDLYFYYHNRFVSVKMSQNSNGFYNRNPKYWTYFTFSYKSSQEYRLFEPVTNENGSNIGYGPIVRSVKFDIEINDKFLLSVGDKLNGKIHYSDYSNLYLFIVPNIVHSLIHFEHSFYNYVTSDDNFMNFFTNRGYKGNVISELLKNQQIKSSHYSVKQYIKVYNNETEKLDTIVVFCIRMTNGQGPRFSNYTNY